MSRPSPGGTRLQAGRLLSLLLAIPVLTLALQAPASARSYRQPLPEGTRLSVRAVQDVVSHKVKTGQLFQLTVTRSVVIKGVKIIAASAPARGVILYSRGSGVGFRGEMMLAVQDVQAVDGSWIPLRAQATAGNGLTRVIPDSTFDLTEPVFPSGKNIRLSYQRVFDAFTDESETFSVTSTSRGTQVKLAPRAAVRRQGLQAVKVSDGVTVRCQPTRELSSGQVETGDDLDFITMAPVLVNGSEVIAQGAPVKGTVLLSRKAGIANKPGLLVLSIDRVQAVDGSWIRLSCSSAGRGSNNKAYSVGISLLVPVVGLAVNGREMVVHQDREFDVYVYDDRYVGVRQTGQK